MSFSSDNSDYFHFHFIFVTCYNPCSTSPTVKYLYCHLIQKQSIQIIIQTKHAEMHCINFTIPPHFNEIDSPVYQFCVVFCCRRQSNCQRLFPSFAQHSIFEKHVHTHSNPTKPTFFSVNLQFLWNTPTSFAIF